MRRSKGHHSELLTHLGYAVRRRRLDINLTQQDLATATKLHRTYITDIEAGRRNLSLLTYGRLTEALRCSLSVPMVDAERTMSTDAVPLYGYEGGLSSASKLLHATGSFVRNLEIESLELAVVANMSKLQLVVETFAAAKKRYPLDALELDLALRGFSFVNPFTGLAEFPTIGSAIDEEFATRTSCILRPGEIEYSPMNKGINYIIRGGGSNSKALPGRSPGSTYVLSGNLRSFNQP